MSAVGVLARPRLIGNKYSAHGYGGFVDTVPLGPVTNGSLALPAGQCHVQTHMPTRLEKIQNGDIDPSFVISHHLPLADAAKGYAPGSPRQP